MKSLLTLTLFSALTLVAGQVVTAQSVHPLFTSLSEADVRKEFGDYEEKGKRCAQEQTRGRRCAAVSFSAEQPLNLPVQTARGVDLLTWRVGLSAPRSVVRSFGYKFGLVARQRTPADREDFLKRLVTRFSGSPREILISVKLVARSDWGSELPELSFELINPNGAKVWSGAHPNFECSERDIICHVARGETGTSVGFPLFLSPGNVPFVTDTMNRLTLVFTLGSHNEQIEFNLSSVI